MIKLRKIFITGGAGFIGSHICEELFHTFKKSKIIIFDKLTYAGNKFFLKDKWHYVSLADLPTGTGLGSSSSFSVCFRRARIYFFLRTNALRIYVHSTFFRCKRFLKTNLFSFAK